jgi:hypothetical protein
VNAPQIFGLLELNVANDRSLDPRANLSEDIVLHPAWILPLKERFSCHVSWEIPLKSAFFKARTLRGRHTV